MHVIFSSPGRSSGRDNCTTVGVGIGCGGGVSKKFTVKFLCDGQGTVRRAILSL